MADTLPEGSGKSGELSVQEMISLIYGAGVQPIPSTAILRNLLPRGIKQNQLCPSWLMS
jgi:hypothetical protein